MKPCARRYNRGLHASFADPLAIEQGKLGIDDSIRKYFPELPDYAGAITVRQLIHHTSGLRDFYTLLAIAGRRQDALYDNVAVLRLAARQKALNFEPGTDYLYSNTGYALLASLIGRATGSSFGAFVDANIFTPLGMTSSHVHDNDARLVKGRAYGYSGTVAGGLRLDTPAGGRVGAGGVFSTVRDLIKWDENFYTGKVGGRALIDQAQTVGKLNDGRALTYAWGLQIGAYRGQRIVEHGGSLGGYRAHLLRFPDRHVSVACLCNFGSTLRADGRSAVRAAGRGFRAAGASEDLRRLLPLYRWHDDPIHPRHDGPRRCALRGRRPRPRHSVRSPYRCHPVALSRTRRAPSRRHGPNCNAAS